VTPEETRHLARGLQVALGVRLEPEAGGGDRGPLAHAGEHVGERAAVGGVIEDVAGGDERRSAAAGQLGERGEARAVVAATAVVGGR
jgi:hypothetical protein